MCEVMKRSQDIQISQLRKVVRRQDQCCEVGYRVRERGLDACDSIARQQQGP